MKGHGIILSHPFIILVAPKKYSNTINAKLLYRSFYWKAACYTKIKWF